jgi:hypothetical protein
LPGPVHRLVRQGQHVSGLVQQHAASRGQPQPLASALKQRRAHDLLQPSDLLAQGRLGNEDLLGGAGKAARIGQRHEVAQMP